MQAGRQAGNSGVAWWPLLGAIATLGSDANIAALGDQICSHRVGSLASAHDLGKDQVLGLSVFKAIGVCLCGTLTTVFLTVLACHPNLGI